MLYQASAAPSRTAVNFVLSVNSHPQRVEAPILNEAAAVWAGVPLAASREVGAGSPIRRRRLVGASVRPHSPGGAVLSVLVLAHALAGPADVVGA